MRLVDQPFSTAWSARAVRRRWQPMRLRCAAVVCLVLPFACRPPADRPLLHPRAFVGRWVRLLPNGMWGDTLDYLPNGRVLGSAGHTVPANARWGVRVGPLGDQFCAADSAGAYCQSSRTYDTLMILEGGPNGNTTFRRVRQPGSARP